MALYFITIEKVGIGLSVLLNGIVLASDSGAQHFKTTVPANIWLKPSSNIVEVRATPPTDESQVGEGITNSNGNDIHVTLFEHDPASALPKAKTVLVQIHADHQSPRSWKEPLQAQLSGVSQSLLWSEALPLKSLTDRDKQMMLAQVKDLTEALLKRDFTGAFLLMAYRFKDESILEGKSVQRVQTAVQELWDAVLGTTNIAAVPFSTDDVRFTIVGENNLVLLSRKDGMPIVLFQDTNMRFGIPLYFSLLEQSWRIIR